MFRPPDYDHNLSMRLSEVLKELGVRENMVKKTRRTWMINDAIWNTSNFLLGNQLFSYFLGSQSEASTTYGLNSDLDNLIYTQRVNVIQDLSQWQPEGYVFQYLMVQNESTSPGYCLLQLLRNDAPLPGQNTWYDGHHIIDSIGRVLLRNGILGLIEGLDIHGPAQTESGPKRLDVDFVQVFHCPSWPKEADPWLQQHNVSGWPTKDMKRYSAKQGCFIVPVGTRTTGNYQDLEWRISTSLAEKCLMYNLNITQIRCYILMKMIIKTFLKPKCGDVVTSFMCKNILFYCIAGSQHGSTWNESSLLRWLNECLQTLFNCILTDNCPHFIIPRNNLLGGKLSAEAKHQLVDIMCTLTANIEESLLGIQIDDFGNRLLVKSGHLLSGVNIEDYTVTLDFYNIHDTAKCLLQRISLTQKRIFQKINVNDQTYPYTVSKLCQLYAVSSHIEKVAIGLLTPIICTTIGSIRASADIHHTRAISSEAFRWFSLGSNSDVSSSRLKYASALYCAGDLEHCEMILVDVTEKLFQINATGEMSPKNVLIMCSCYPGVDANVTNADIEQLSCFNNENVIKHNMAFCVRYLPNEVNCVPFELRYEMFRSTKEDRPYRKRWDYWMNWAVVDSLTCLFFLQYKVFSQLQCLEEQHQTLDNLVNLINAKLTLGHRETALNLLGQLMVQEGRYNDALYYYMWSLKIRRRNNAAIWHVCILLARLLRR